MPILKEVVGLLNKGEGITWLHLLTAFSKNKKTQGGFESMKNLKKLLAAVLVIAMMVTIMIPAFAAEESTFSYGPAVY